MNRADFLQILDTRIEKIKSVLEIKQGEYSRDGDRLSNFKRAAAMLKCTPAKACVGAWSKHLTSILDMVDDAERGISWTLPIWEEKIGDAINYLILLEAIIKEPYVYDQPEDDKPQNAYLGQGNPPSLRSQI